MAVATQFGPTPWASKEVATACSITISNTTRKLAELEERLFLLCKLMSIHQPAQREDNIAEILTATFERAAKLSNFDRRRFKMRLRELLKKTKTTFTTQTCPYGRAGREHRDRRAKKEKSGEKK